MNPSQIDQQEEELIVQNRPADRETDELSIESNLLKWMLTIALFMSWICLGMNNEIIPPTVKGMMINAETDLRGIGTIMSFRGFGYFLGSFMGGLFGDMLPKQLILHHTIALFILTLSCLMIPYCYKVVTLSIAFFIAGIGHGWLTTSGNPLISRIWNKSSKSVFNLIHSGYGFGAVLVPILLQIMYINEFSLIPGKRKPIANLTLPSDGPKKASGNFVPAFQVVGSITGVTGFVVLAFFIVILKRARRTAPAAYQDNKITEAVEVKNCLRKTASRIKVIYCQEMGTNKLVVLLAFLFYSNLVGNDKVTNKYLYEYINNRNNTANDKSEAPIVQIAFWLAFSGSRFLSFFILKKLSLYLLFHVNLLLTLIISIVFASINASQYALLGIMIFLALLKAPLYPTGFGIISKAGPVSGLLVMLINVGSSIGASLFPFIAGHLIKSYGWFYYPIVLLVAAILIFIFGNAFSFYIRSHGKTMQKIEIKPVDEPL